MEKVSALVTALSSAVLLLFCYAFAPWPGNWFGGVALAGVPIWIACAVLALGLFAIAVHNLRLVLRQASRLSAAS